MTDFLIWIKNYEISTSWLIFILGMILFILEACKMLLPEKGEKWEEKNK